MTYTWGEIQIATIKKMFLNNAVIDTTDLATMRTDKKYQTYLSAMVSEVNVGINIILSRGKKLTQRVELTTTNATSSDDEYYHYDLEDLITNFKRLNNIIVYKGYDYVSNATSKNPKIVTILKTDFDTYSFYVSVDIKPTKITEATLDSAVVVVPEDTGHLLPLYLASELYKDDDISMSTLYRNQFEVELQSLRNEDDELELTSVSGWL